MVIQSKQMGHIKANDASKVYQMIQQNFLMSTSKNQNKDPICGRRGRWTPAENLLYKEFVLDRKNTFMRTDSRRSNRIFKEMSKVITTRNAIQCRSHHQKMQNMYGSLSKLLDALLHRKKWKLDFLCANALQKGSAEENQSLEPDPAILEKEVSDIIDFSISEPTSFQESNQIFGLEQKVALEEIGILINFIP